jgi:2-phospho-L-lactate guanylyltransferase
VADEAWTAIIPFKPAGQRKRRLAGMLSPARRDQLAETMFLHVVGVLEASPLIDRIVLLAAAAGVDWPHGWIADTGGGLNAELSCARDRLGAARLIVIHADLPFVTPADIAALTAAAKSGCAIAPDRHQTGTNALALQDFPGFAFAFGDSSLARHRAAAGGRARIVTTRGLAHDIDTPADAAALTEGTGC